MTTDDRPTGPGATAARHYELRVQGRLGARWSAWFDGLDLTEAADGTTVISGPIADQAALHGVLQKLRDVGLPLVSLTELPTHPSPAHRTHEGN